MTLSTAEQRLAYNRAVARTLESYVRLSNVRMDVQSQSIASCQQRVVLPEVTTALLEVLRDLASIAPGRLTPRIREGLKAALKGVPHPPRGCE
jgi:5,10-methenyltetrahydromethanopterin hydrogenase